jgi:hypothetical protein
MSVSPGTRQQRIEWAIGCAGCPLKQAVLRADNSLRVLAGGVVA